MYQYAWTILLAPLCAFVVIIFGTRPWDLLSRPRNASATDAASHGHEAHDSHNDQGEHETDDNTHAFHGVDDDDDPQVPALTVGARVSAYVAMLFMAFACVFSWVLLLTSIGHPMEPQTVLSYTWLQNPHYEIAFHIDQLGIAMMVVVTTITFLVQFYSQGYMENSAGYARFYSYLSLFSFSMLVIVFSQNFLVIFCGWELVGLSSYLLIGFWINKRAKPDEQRPAPSSASLQSFVMNRIGDVGFILGIMILFANTGSFDFGTVFAAAPHMDKTLLGIAMLLIFCGAVGKSAQFPLHTWLPSAMEGPTPVSALIHAATMVAAGVYMVARTFPLFLDAAPFALLTVGYIGAITAFFAATIALVQSDFKRVLAFSTISQLGYMFVGLALGGEELGTGPGMFHLFTHAFFKALLFLGAGSVLHGLHHATHREVQDMRLMGGLATRMPITALTWLIATLAISGFPGFAGFFSKETIIGLAFEHGQANGDWGLYALTLVTAGLTAFYMLRAFILAFGGKGGKLGGLWGGPYRGEGHVHESPLTMTIPLLLLAIPSVIAGYWTGFFQYVDPEAHANLNIPHMLGLADTWIGVIVSLLGFGVAFALYARMDQARLHAFVERNGFLRGLHRVLYNRYYIDALYNWFTNVVIIGGLCVLAQLFDTYVVDGIVNGVARLVTGAGKEVRLVETGRVQSYMIGFFGGVAVLTVLVVVLVNYVK
jgi:NADH-quinone oxidoreductase subunit L